ncbi:hypothetical protein J8TS2_34700 [Lederbergia ruris]|uniref:Uncharacterized protein n=1 Tax=Lederbergia ruris TaxID=217495 RepID=A0ABQ4KMJ1_9BACI|nr:hypothetical protein J8TS2_34700 [Lederbergia ruris]
MKLTSKMIISVIVGLLMLGGTFAFINGWITTAPKDTHPPCDQLPTVTEATDALNDHGKLAKEIERLGEGIKVEVDRPCPDDLDRGLILVTYDSKAEREAIRHFLTRSEGFEVPVHLVRR